MQTVQKSSVDILGVPVARLDQDALFSQVLDWALANGNAVDDRPQSGFAANQIAKPRTICYANAHSLNTAWEIEPFRAILSKADLVYADGISVVWAARFLHGVRLVKLTGRAWILPFCQRAAQQAARLFFLGGRSGVAKIAADRLQMQFPGLQMVGAHDGFIQEEPLAETLRQINQARPHLLMVGLGTPVQEEWIFAHRAKIHAPVCWAVGALFDYVAGLEQPVPRYLDNLGLESFWRLLQNPRGKWKRYLIGNPLFLWRVLREAAKHRC